MKYGVSDNYTPEHGIPLDNAYFSNNPPNPDVIHLL